MLGNPVPNELLFIIHSLGQALYLRVRGTTSGPEPIDQMLATNFFEKMHSIGPYQQVERPNTFGSILLVRMIIRIVGHIVCCEHCLQTVATISKSIGVHLTSCTRGLLLLGCGRKKIYPPMPSKKLSSVCRQLEEMRQYVGSRKKIGEELLILLQLLLASKQEDLLSKVLWTIYFSLQLFITVFSSKVFRFLSFP